MPPTLALLLTIGFVIFLFRWESRNTERFSRDLWIPLIWILITGSRFVSQWLKIWGLLPGGEGSEASSYEEGSPLDALVFLALIIVGCVILRRRQISVGGAIRNNLWLSIFLIYCLVSIVWSDFPFVAFKRWIKVLGLPIMALIVVTEPRPMTAIRGLLKRAGYVLLLFSFMCIKYFPEIGRGFDVWGQGQNRGVNINKNELGYCCLLFGLFFFWNLLQALQLKEQKARRNEIVLNLGFLAMSWWLLSLAGSATSLTCLIIGATTMVLLGTRLVNWRYLGVYVVVGVLVFGAAETLFNVTANVVRMLEKDPTLTDRTVVWADALALVENPILGAGFESFWLGERLEKLWAKWWWGPTQAHNGYIETYLNLGGVGVVLLIVLLLSTFQRIKMELLRSLEWGRFRMGYFVPILFYNYTEAAFKGVSLLWLFFYFIAMDYPRFGRDRLVTIAEPAGGMDGKTGLAPDVTASEWS